MQQLQKAQAWVVDSRTQLCVDAVVAFFHWGREEEEISKAPRCYFQFGGTTP